MGAFINKINDMLGTQEELLSDRGHHFGRVGGTGNGSRPGILNRRRWCNSVRGNGCAGASEWKRREEQLACRSVEEVKNAQDCAA